MFKVLVALAVVADAAVALFVVRRVVSAWRLQRGFDAFGEARKRRQRVVVTATDEEYAVGCGCSQCRGHRE